ncbi:MAG: hypothetical protein ABR975_15640, partial [Vulcanimicrobiaceae bacterium]
MNEITTAGVELEFARIRADLRTRLDSHRSPFHVADRDAALAAIDRLESAEPEHWVTVWGEAAA